MEFLKFNISPWDSVIKYWDESIFVRSELKNENGGSVEIFLDTFPIMKHPNEYTLVN